MAPSKVGKKVRPESQMGNTIPDWDLGGHLNGAAGCKYKWNSVRLMHFAQHHLGGKTFLNYVLLWLQYLQYPIFGPACTF